MPPYTGTGPLHKLTQTLTGSVPILNPDTGLVPEGTLKGFETIAGRTGPVFWQPGEYGVPRLGLPDTSGPRPGTGPPQEELARHRLPVLPLQSLGFGGGPQQPRAGTGPPQEQLAQGRQQPPPGQGKDDINFNFSGNPFGGGNPFTQFPSFPGIQQPGPGLQFLLRLLTGR